jgi:hypothetical protein
MARINAPHVWIWPEADVSDRARYFRSLGLIGRDLPGSQSVEDDPNVWSGRASQEVFFGLSALTFLAVAGLSGFRV